MRKYAADEALVYVALLGLVVVTPLAGAGVYYYGPNNLTVSVIISGAMAFVITFLLPVVVLGFRSIREQLPY